MNSYQNAPMRNRNVNLKNSDTFKVVNKTIYTFKPIYLYDLSLSIYIYIVPWYGRANTQTLKVSIRNHDFESES